MQAKSSWIISVPKLDRPVPSSGPSSHRFSSSSQNSVDFKKEVPNLPPTARILGRTRPTGTKLKKLLGLDMSRPLLRDLDCNQMISTEARTSPWLVTPPATRRKVLVAAHPGPFLFVLISGHLSTGSHSLLVIEYSRTLCPESLPMMT